MIKLRNKSKEDFQIMLSTDNYTQKLLGLEDVIITKVQRNLNETLIFIELPKKPHICPYCASITTRINNYRFQKIKDLPAFMQKTYLLLRKRRYFCSSCNKAFYENNNFITKYQRMTDRFTQHIISKLAEMRSYTSIASELGCSNTTVIRKANLISYPKAQLPKVLAIDEFKGNTDHEKYQCIITDVAKKQTLDILPNRKVEDLYQYFMSFSKAERDKVAYIVMDMSTLFRRLAKTCFPNASIVADKFHFIRLVNWALEHTRKSEQKKFSKQRRIYFKKSRWILTKSFHKLTSEEQLQLLNMISISENIRKAYMLKELFHNAINSEDILKNLLIWYEKAKQSGIEKFSKLADTIYSWKNEIIAALNTGFTNGYTEGCNNRAKVLKRVSFGLRNFNRFRNRLLFIASSKS